MDETRAMRVHMMAAETISAGILLREHMEPIPNTRFHRYKDGWDDERIAKEVSDRLNAEHIFRLRKQLDLIQPKITFRSNIDGAAVLAKIDLLIEQHNKLCDLISLNRVADARACKVDLE